MLMGKECAGFQSGSGAEADAEMDDNMLSEVGGSTRQSSASNSGHTEHEPMADEALLTLCAAGLGDPMKTSSVADLAAELGQTAAGRIRELQKRTLDLLETNKSFWRLGLQKHFQQDGLAPIA
ncbi:unnamed protein product [Polarella glacialis]|uniref:Uncharacterized protein n=1 Tax=Polarella glacialis TaxID=89957 RepID=A0A813IYZ5_POLGL|nr:unnamed protein product [Polarella glacialis]